MSHYQDPYQPTSITESQRFLFVTHLLFAGICIKSVFRMVVVVVASNCCFGRFTLLQVKNITFDVVYLLHYVCC